jgi:MFS transporter, FHS family, Na+ dependent glucose transporter 1
MTRTILYFLAFISLGLVSGSLGPTIPALAARTASRMHEISGLFLIRSFGTMAGAMFIGRFYDRIAGHRLLAGSLLASTVMMGLTPMADTLWMLLAVSTLLGIAGGSINVGGNALIVLEHRDRARPFLSSLHFAFGLGGFLAPILFTWLLGRADALQLTYWTLAAAGIPTGLALLFVKSPPIRPHAEQQAAGALPRSMLALFLLFFFLEVGAEASVMGWYFSYAAGRGESAHTAGLMNSGFWAAFTVGRLATVWLSVRAKAISVILVQLCLAIGLAIVMLVLPPSPVLLWIGAIGFGLAVAPIFPSTFGYAQRLMGLSGRLTGYFLVGSSAGGMFWPWLIGQFFQSRGPQVVMIVVLLDLIGALAAIQILHRANVKSPAEQTPVCEAIEEGRTEPV